MFIAKSIVRVAAVLSLVCGCVFLNGTVFADSLSEGKQLLFENKDIVGAHAKFDTALADNPTGQVENFWHAITVIAQNDVLKTKLRDLGIFNSDNQLAIFDNEGNISYDFEAQTYPNMTQVQDMFNNSATGIVLQIDEALDNLSCVYEDFQDTLVMGSDTITIDYGDAATLKMALYSLKAAVKINAAYGMNNLDIKPILFNNGNPIDPFSILNANLPLLTLREGADTYLSDAMSALLSAIDSFFSGSEFILARDENDGDGLNHIVRFYDPYPVRDDGISDEAWQNIVSEWQEDKDASLERAEFAYNSFTDIQNNLTDHEGYPFVTIPAEFPGMDGAGPGISINVDLYRFFTNPTDIRYHINQLTNNGDASNIVFDNFSDATVGGVFPSMTPSDWNYIFSFGPHQKDEPRIVWNDETASVELGWDMSGNQYASFVTRYEIYRSSSADMSDAVLVDTITDKTVMAYTDTSVDSSTGRYYYRIYAHYDINGNTATSYGETGKAILRVYVDANSCSEEEDGTMGAPYKSLGYATSEGSGNGTKVCVAAGTYYENTDSLKLWRVASIKLEGGYEPLNWTRDIATNETIIDGSGFNTWALLQIWNSGGFTIDGFTITGGSNTERGIQAYKCQMSVKNCKIMNFKGAMILDSCPAVSIKNCDMTGLETTGFEGIVFNNIENEGASLNVKNCSITNYNGTGITIWGYSNTSMNIFNNIIANGKNEGIHCGGDHGSVSIVNNTIFGNANAGVSFSGNSLCSITIQNNILVNNSIGIYGSGDTGITRVITNNDAYGNVVGNYYNCGTDVGQGGNISTDPFFVEGTYCLSQITSGQTVNSPCVDAGSDTAANLGLNDKTTRNDGKADSGMVDMGCHSQATSAAIYKADLVVDFGSDYGIYVYSDTGAWTQLHIFTAKSITAGDIDGNGKDDIIVDFGSEYGIYVYSDTGAWTQLHNFTAQSITAADLDGNGKADLVVDFGSDYGIYVYSDTGAWTQLHIFTAKSITAGELNGQ
ncbi:MAG: right-handed parallel beta-helix repeat-containing protein [Candidatus Omnitrophica bacterium]|nr:right-handed parallel beta-helix repeat-containing protein [Candidatus Omnitrophota bacterium]